MSQFGIDPHRSDACDDMPGIYVVQAGVTPYVKIGYSGNIPQRMRELQTGCPFTLFLLADSRPFGLPGEDLEIH